MASNGAEEQARRGVGEDRDGDVTAFVCGSAGAVRRLGSDQRGVATHTKRPHIRRSGGVRGWAAIERGGVAVSMTLIQ